MMSRKFIAAELLLSRGAPYSEELIKMLNNKPGLKIGLGDKLKLMINSKNLHEKAALIFNDLVQLSFIGEKLLKKFPVIKIASYFNEAKDVSPAMFTELFKFAEKFSNIREYSPVKDKILDKSRKIIRELVEASLEEASNTRG